MYTCTFNPQITNAIIYINKKLIAIKRRGTIKGHSRQVPEDKSVLDQATNNLEVK